MALAISYGCKWTNAQRCFAHVANNTMDSQLLNVLTNVCASD